MTYNSVKQILLQSKQKVIKEFSIIIGDYYSLCKISSEEWDLVEDDLRNRGELKLYSFKAKEIINYAREVVKNRFSKYVCYELLDKDDCDDCECLRKIIFTMFENNKPIMDYIFNGIVKKCLFIIEKQAKKRYPDYITIKKDDCVILRKN